GGVVLFLSIILALLSYLQYARHRDLMLRNLESWADQSSDVIESSLRHAMLTQDFAEVQQIMDAIGREPGITGLFLLNREGEIRIAPEGKMVGTKLDISDPTCQVCHRYAPQNRKGSVILTTASGEKVFRSMNPIDNRKECHNCHDPQTKINGVLITDFSMAEIERHLAQDLRDSLLWSGAAIVIIVLAVNLMMSHIVITRLERFVQAIKLFGQGDLEQRVTIKGRDEIWELADSFNRMADGLKEKEEENIRLYRELRQKETLRGQLLEKVISAQEDERKAIARELHDELAQTLTALTMSLDAAEQILPPDQTHVKEQLERTRSLTIRTLRQIRKLILDLRPTMLDDLGLVSAIRWYAENNLEAIGIKFDVKATGARRRLPPQIEITLFRIIQEAINNIAKHSKAHHVSIQLAFKDSVVTGIVEDDGEGFDIEKTLASKEGTQGLGLLGMKERATLFGGTLDISSLPGKGTRIQVEIPLRAGVTQSEQDTYPGR
ncbi:MAG: histidine kinase, partial [Anaerolineae bacterium]